MTRIIDTYPYFEELWAEAQPGSPGELAEVWERYVSLFPELYRLQERCHSGTDWKTVAARRVFPRLASLIGRVREARRNLAQVIPRAYRVFEEYWHLHMDPVFVVYVDVGCGAGWAAEYEGCPAVLLGLESIAELGWHRPRLLERLVIHELCHLAHAALRGIPVWGLEELEEDPYLLLYIEGFATRCEHLVMGGEHWLMAPSREWVEQCRSMLPRLAEEYLRRAERGEPVNDFYGHWLSVEGLSMAGYYLGHELVKRLGDIRKVAVMDVGKVQARARELLQELARPWRGR